MRIVKPFKFERQILLVVTQVGNDGSPRLPVLRTAGSPFGSLIAERLRQQAKCLPNPTLYGQREVERLDGREEVYWYLVEAPRKLLEIKAPIAPGLGGLLSLRIETEPLDLLRQMACSASEMASI